MGKPLTKRFVCLLFVCLFVCLFVGLFVCLLFVCLLLVCLLFVCLSVCLFVCLLTCWFLDQLLEWLRVQVIEYRLTQGRQYWLGMITIVWRGQVRSILVPVNPGKNLYRFYSACRQTILFTCRGGMGVTFLENTWNTTKLDSNRIGSAHGMVLKTYQNM